MRPDPVSSGRTDHHRLDPGGNRQLNHAFHMLALTKLIHDPWTAVRIAKQRKNGMTSREAMRSLKSHLVHAFTTSPQPRPRSHDHLLDIPV
jgi:transposase